MFHCINSGERLKHTLSGKGSLLVWKGFVQLLSPSIGEPQINKCPESNFLLMNVNSQRRIKSALQL